MHERRKDDDDAYSIRLLRSLRPPHHSLKILPSAAFPHPHLHSLWYPAHVFIPSPPLLLQAVQPEKGAAMAWVLSTGLIASVDSAFTDWFGHKWVTPGLATTV